MLIFFGWGHTKVKNIGPTFKHRCVNCNNEEYWNLSKISTWFTLFFIPVFPYEFKYFFFCPVCERGVFLKKEEFQKLEPFAALNTELVEGKITEEQFLHRLNMLNSAPQPVQRDEPLEITAPAVQHTQQSFCTQCGHQLIEDVNFCKQCGAPVKNKKKLFA